MFINRLYQLCEKDKSLTSARVVDLMRELKIGRQMAQKVLGDFVALVVKKRQLSTSALLEYFSEDDKYLYMRGERFNPEYIEKSSTHLNVSLYLLERRILKWGLDRLKPIGAQGEEYLTDLINDCICRSHSQREGGCRIIDVPLSDPQMVMSYNTEEQLMKIEALLD